MLRMIGLSFALIASFIFVTVARASVENKQNQRDASRTAQHNVSLSFKSAVDVQRTKIRISGADGEVKIGSAYIGGRGQDLIIPLPRELAPGLYFVTFDAYSTQGNRDTGISEIVVPDKNWDATMQPVAQAVEP